MLCPQLHESCGCSVWYTGDGSTRKPQSLLSDGRVVYYAASQSVGTASKIACPASWKYLLEITENIFNT